MKAGIVGMGTVGRAAAAAMLQRGSCRELVLVNRRREVAEAVALDLRYGVPLSARPSRSVPATTTTCAGRGWW